MINALAESVLETRHLYQQVAAMRHGAPDPPRRVTTRVSVQQPASGRNPATQPEPKQQPAQPQPHPQAQQPPVINATWRPAAPPPAQSSTPGWVLPASLIAGPLLALAGLGTGAYLFRDNTPPPTPPPAVQAEPDPGTPLLEYLDERGYARPPR